MQSICLSRASFQCNINYHRMLRALMPTIPQYNGIKPIPTSSASHKTHLILLKGVLRMLLHPGRYRANLPAWVPLFLGQDTIIFSSVVRNWYQRSSIFPYYQHLFTFMNFLQFNLSGNIGLIYFDTAHSEIYLWDHKQGYSNMRFILLDTLRPTKKW